MYVSLQIATLVQNALSAMTAGDASQYKLRMLSCCVVLHKLSMCNFDSCKSLTCYMSCTNSINKINNSTGEFWVLSLRFPSF